MSNESETNVQRLVSMSYRRINRMENRVVFAAVQAVSSNAFGVDISQSPIHRGVKVLKSGVNLVDFVKEYFEPMGVNCTVLVQAPNIALDLIPSKINVRVWFEKQKVLLDYTFVEWTNDEFIKIKNLDLSDNEKDRDREVFEMTKEGA